MAASGGSTKGLKFDLQCPVEGPDDKHDCEWRQQYDALATDFASLRHEFETLKRNVIGKKSEKMPSVESELRDSKPADKAKAQATRKERTRARQKTLKKLTTVHAVPASQRKCPKCGGEKLKSVGTGKESVVFEFIPASFVAHKHVRETLACPCGEHMVTADGPTKWVEKSQYAPSFIAHIITAKCADAIPLYRQEKELQRIGVPVARSTMTDLFHRAAEQVQPLVDRLLELIREADVVRADETSQKVLAKGTCKTGFIWTFRARVPQPIITYRFAMNRSGDTPLEVLGCSKGKLVVDGYTGYNNVTDVNGRIRVGCNAHSRRYFFDAQQSAPDEARKAIDFILGLYRVEHAARDAGILGTPAHLALRKEHSAPIRVAFKTWLDEQRPRFAPKTPMGRAITYTLNQWTHLGRFLEDAAIPLDNNESEAALRRVALGRKNFMFVGNKDAGENLAGLYSLVATCEANDVNPVAYLTDILARLNDFPNSRIDELLPHRWRPSD